MFNENLERIIDRLKCPYGFVCYNSNLKELCKAKDIGMESFLVCLEEKPEECVFSMSLADSKFCRCQVRVYIAKVLKK
jgi:hypothetical protein